MLLAGISALAAPHATAREHGGALDAARRAGRLRIGITAWVQLPPSSVLPAGAPPRDPFSEELARRLAGAMGLRAELESMSLPGEALAWLSQGRIDLALAPVFARFTAREAMFARPHLAVETVVVAPAELRQRRRLSEWAGQRLAVMPGFQRVLEDLGHPFELVQAVPVADVLAMERALMDGRAFGAIATSLQARAFQRRNPDANLLIRTALAVHPMAAAVAFGEHDLLRAVDQVMMLKLERGEVQALYRESFGLPFPPLTAFS